MTTSAEPFDYVATMNRLMLLVPILADAAEDIQQCQAVITRAHSLGAVLDPTAYRNGMQNLDDAEAMLNALAPCAHQLAALRAQLLERPMRGSRL